jgi:hypothetical protein
MRSTAFSAFLVLVLASTLDQTESLASILVSYLVGYSNGFHRHQCVDWSDTERKRNSLGTPTFVVA